MQAPVLPHCPDHYLLDSWTPLQPNKCPDTMSLQCCNIWLIQSTLSNLQLIIWMFCLQDAKHLDWLKKSMLIGLFFFLNWIGQMFWHHVDTSLSPAFVLMACLHNVLSTCNMTCLLNAMFSLPSKLWSEFPPPQSSSRLIPLNHSLCSF